MPEQVFSDLDRRVLVRLSPERLTYEAADGPGWQCRVDDIRWTSSEVNSRGIQEVRLHGAGDRVVVTLLRFDGIERFYLALLRLLAERPAFAGIREEVPSQVPLLERMLWMAAHAPAEDGEWSFFRAVREAAVAGAEGGLLVSAAPEALERVPWSELAGLRSRGGVTRIYRARDFLEVPLPGLAADLKPPETGAEYAPTSSPAADPRLAMDYSWELERARGDEVLAPDERVLASAFGQGEGRLAPAGSAGAGSLAALNTVLARVGNNPELPRCEVLLTDRRLLLLERERGSGTLLSRQELELERLPRLKRVDNLLILGRFELLPDPAVPGMGADFVKRYRSLVADRFDPFGELPEPDLASRVASHRPDPFAPTLERPLDLQP